MKPKIHFRIISLTATVLLIPCLTGCKDMFKDPMLDKKTGDQVTLLLLDRNFIKTKLSIRLQDIATLNDIDQEQVEIRFMGDDAANLITFTGNKKSSFNTSTGFVEVGYDPNIVIDNQNPVELTIIAMSLNYISAPQFVSYTTEGIKNVIIKMAHKIIGKSISSGPFSEPFDLNYNGIKNSDQLRFISDIGSSPTGTAWDYLNLYSTASNGTLLCNNLNDNIIYTDYGAYFFGLVSGLSLVPPALPTKNVGLQSGDFVYSTVLRSGLLKCDQGLTIHVERADGKAGSGVFDYRITFSDGTTKSGRVSCTFPSDNLIEQIYYPASNAAVSVELFGDAQYDMSPAVPLSSPCGANANFFAAPKSNLKAYKFITQYSCPDSPVGMGLSIMGEFRKVGTLNPWTSFQFFEGVCELQLEPNADYDFRVSIDGEYYYYSLPTDVTKVEDFLLAGQNEDYRLRSLSVNPTDTLVTITAEIEFSQVVCDAIQ
ncbi:MAG: hypothetical protein D4R64_17855 [Porphyromonadaceae bacterium]|nr:MAG: hypothetical protein D4R64_17855 [Porphyromonadaceae bacterium]